MQEFGKSVGLGSSSERGERKVHLQLHKNVSAKEFEQNHQLTVMLEKGSRAQKL